MSAVPHAVAPALAALGDETRMRIVERLAVHGPLPIVRLADGATMTRQAVTKHLDRLADAGVVRSERRGRERVWILETTRLGDVRTYLERISTLWDRRIERLRALVEADGLERER